MKRLFYKLAPYLVLIIGLATTIGMWQNSIKELQLKEAKVIDKLAERVKNNLKERLMNYANALYAGVGLFKSSQNVEKDEWAMFIHEMQVLERMPGINGIGYTKEIKHEDLNKFLLEARVDGNGLDYKIKPKGIRNNYFVIKYIEPLESNYDAWGYDMGSEAKRREALEQARDTGKISLSHQVILVQDKEKTPGFLMYVPFYTSNQNLNSIKARRDNFAGWIYAPFISKAFIEGLFTSELPQFKDKIVLEIFDGKDDKANLLYSNRSLELNRDYQFKSKSLEIYGQTWYLNVGGIPSEIENINYQEGYLIIVLGSILSFLLFLLVFSISQTREKAIILAEEMTKELNEKNKILEKRNQELDAFAYIASHDLKEPLRTVYSYVGLLEKQLNKTGTLQDDNSKEKIFFEYIKDSCQTMTTLINDLLEFSRVGKQEIEEKVDTQELLKLTLKELDHDIKSSKANITCKTLLPSIKGNPSDIKRIFQNLIANSLKYKKPELEPNIEINYQNLGNEAHEFTITDNGIGISPEYKEQIFTIFRRLHTKEEYPGTGIGLAICKKAVENHNGKIWVESSPGNGSTFHFTVNTEKFF